MAAALKYQPGEQSAPLLLAAGRGHLAERIVETARTSGVPVQEDPQLAQILCSLKIGQEIPPELYQAVAEVLAFVMLLEMEKDPSSGKKGL